ncbi:hypothetical protein Btru_007465 [Bulinus truncatus]|nr:hypothetical protein Btru_007465 [Bulinus truncatus]
MSRRLVTHEEDFICNPVGNVVQSSDNSTSTNTTSASSGVKNESTTDSSTSLDTPIHQVPTSATPLTAATQSSEIPRLKNDIAAVDFSIKYLNENYTVELINQTSGVYVRTREKYYNKTYQYYQDVQGFVNITSIIFRKGSLIVDFSASFQYFKNFTDGNYLNSKLVKKTLEKIRNDRDVDFDYTLPLFLQSIQGNKAVGSGVCGDKAMSSGVGGNKAVGSGVCGDKAVSSGVVATKLVLQVFVVSAVGPGSLWCTAVVQVFAASKPRPAFVVQLVRPGLAGTLRVQCVCGTKLRRSRCLWHKAVRPGACGNKATSWVQVFVAQLCVQVLCGNKLVGPGACGNSAVGPGVSSVTKLVGPGACGNSFVRLRSCRYSSWSRQVCGTAVSPGALWHSSWVQVFVVLCRGSRCLWQFVARAVVQVSCGNKAVGSGVCGNKAVGSGVCGNKAVGSGVCGNKAVGSGVCGNKAVGSGVCGNKAVRSGVCGNKAVSSGVCGNKAVGSGVCGNKAVRSGVCGNKAVGSGVCGNKAVGSGVCGNKAVSSGVCGNKAVGSGVCGNKAVSSGVCGNKAVSSGVCAVSSGVCGNKDVSSGVCGNKDVGSGVCGNKAVGSGVCGNKAVGSGVCGNKAVSSGVCGNKAVSSGVCGNKAVSSGVCGNKAVSSGVCDNKAGLDVCHLYQCKPGYVCYQVKGNARCKTELLCDEKCHDGECVFNKDFTPVCRCSETDNVVYTGSQCQETVEKFALKKDYIIAIAAGGGGGVVLIFCIIIMAMCFKINNNNNNSMQVKESIDEKDNRSEQSFQSMKDSEDGLRQPYTINTAMSDPTFRLVTMRTDRNVSDFPKPFTVQASSGLPLVKTSSATALAGNVINDYQYSRIRSPVDNGDMRRQSRVRVIDDVENSPDYDRRESRVRGSIDATNIRKNSNFSLLPQRRRSSALADVRTSNVSRNPLYSMPQSRRKSSVYSEIEDNYSKSMMYQPGNNGELPVRQTGNPRLYDYYRRNDSVTSPGARPTALSDIYDYDEDNSRMYGLRKSQQNHMPRKY